MKNSGCEIVHTQSFVEPHFFYSEPASRVDVDSQKIYLTSNKYFIIIMLDVKQIGGNMEPIKKLIKQAATQIDREREKFANSLGITGVQMTVLDFVFNQADHIVSQHQLEEEFNLRRSTVTIMLQRMEKRGLIKKLDDKKDKRKKLVTLTDKSINLIPEIKGYMQADDQDLRKKFTDNEIDVATAILNYIKGGKADD